MIQPRIWTFGRQSVNPTELRYEEIRVEDIAHALACCNRFAGHAKEPISVAQHSVYASWLCPQPAVGLSCRGIALQALLHDASEAYLGDVTRWLKGSPAMAGYRDVEAQVQRAIYRRFNLAETDDDLVRAADRLLVRYEMQQGFGDGCTVGSLNGAEHPDYPPITTAEIQRIEDVAGPWSFWSWRRAESQFLRTFHHLANLMETNPCT